MLWSIVVPTCVFPCMYVALGVIVAMFVGTRRGRNFLVPLVLPLHPFLHPKVSPFTLLSLALCTQYPISYIAFHSVYVYTLQWQTITLLTGIQDIGTTAGGHIRARPLLQKASWTTQATHYMSLVSEHERFGPTAT